MLLSLLQCFIWQKDLLGQDPKKRGTKKKKKKKWLWEAGCHLLHSWFSTSSLSFPNLKSFTAENLCILQEKSYSIPQELLIPSPPSDSAVSYVKHLRMGQPSCQEKAIKNGVLWPRLTRIPTGIGLSGPCVRLCEVAGPSHSSPRALYSLWSVLLAHRCPPPFSQFQLSTSKLFSQTCCCFQGLGLLVQGDAGRLAEWWGGGAEGEISPHLAEKACWALLAGISWEPSATVLWSLSSRQSPTAILLPQSEILLPAASFLLPTYHGSTAIRTQVKHFWDFLKYLTTRSPGKEKGGKPWVLKFQMASSQNKIILEECSWALISFSTWNSIFSPQFLDKEMFAIMCGNTHHSIPFLKYCISLLTWKLFL